MSMKEALKKRAKSLYDKDDDTIIAEMKACIGPKGYYEGLMLTDIESGPDEVPERVQLFGVSLHHEFIYLIKNPTESAMLLQIDCWGDPEKCGDGVDNWPWDIKKPTPKVIKAMIKSHGTFPEHLSRFSNEVQQTYLKVIKSDPELHQLWISEAMEYNLAT
jgi:hypothetical protein